MSNYLFNLVLNSIDKGQGIYDLLIDKVSKALPEYEHIQVEMNTQRVLAELQKGAKVCHPSALRETPALLSMSNSFLLPHRIIYDTYDKPELSQLTSVSLEQLLVDNEVKVGIAGERYSALLNKIINQHKDQESLININNYNSLIRMFFRKRIDALIEYPPVITYSKRMLNEAMNNSSIAIAELASTQYLPVYFACPDNEWGQEVIKKINQILINEAQEQNYLAFRLRWYDEKSQKLLKKYYAKDYLKDKQISEN